ncbi:hypothetical protein C8R45DRAFT_982404 [Mycena sanguinolenta]|nr:hypothetical protein C8R45DRAFT_982404 [Mycena sanguinolenta]
MLRTATRLARRPQNAPLVSQSRPASSAVAHDHHHEQEDDTVYPKEGFGAPIWRKTLVCAASAILFYEFFGAPADNDQPWVPATTAGSPTDLASTRAAKEDTLLKERQLVRTATRPIMYRSRGNPEDKFHNVSPYSHPVGQTVEWQKPSRLPKLPARLVEAVEAQSK